MSDHFGTLCIKGLKLFQERCLKPALDQQINLIRLIRLVFCIRFIWQTVTHRFFEGHNLSSMFFFTPLLSLPPFRSISNRCFKRRTSHQQIFFVTPPLLRTLIFSFNLKVKEIIVFIRTSDNFYTLFLLKKLLMK